MASHRVVESVADTVQTAEIQGQIQQCSSEKNGKRYIVVWSHTLRLDLTMTCSAPSFPTCQRSKKHWLMPSTTTGRFNLPLLVVMTPNKQLFLK
jgi:hypothetical protein